MITTLHIKNIGIIDEQEKTKEPKIKYQQKHHKKKINNQTNKTKKNPKKNKI